MEKTETEQPREHPSPGLDRVTWVPAPLEDGSVSMWKYWSSIHQASLSLGWDMNCLLGAPPKTLPSRKSRLHRAIHKSTVYPRRLRNYLNDGKEHVVHFLDHSSAAMVPHVPAPHRVVVTVHDLIPIRFNRGLRPHQVQRFRRAMENLHTADALVAVSEYTKQELISLLQVDPDKVFVVPNGVDTREVAPPSERLELETWISDVRSRGVELVLLCIGSSIRRKNLAGLLEGLIHYEKRNGTGSVALLRIGQMVEKGLATEFRSALGDRFLEAGRLTESGLYRAYHLCDVVVVPSLYEGFGLPVLEGMAHGKPVLSSDRTSLPEVGGGVARYFRPSCCESFCKALEEMKDEELRTRLGGEGLTRAREFSWERHLQGLRDVYLEILSKTGAKGS